MRTLSMESNELKHIIETKIRHPYVEKYINKPFIDYNKIFILNYLYNDLQMPTKMKQQYITTIMLVQIALDTHELIPSHKSNRMTETEKQLSVLAGDYYSGLYYSLLSDLEDIEMIQVLAKAIKNINEQKITLFYDDVQTVDDLFISLQQIESLLFTEVALIINVDDSIIPIIQEFLLISRLYKEKESILNNEFSYIDKYVQIIEPNSNPSTCIQIIENELENRKEKMDELLVHLPYNFIILKQTIRNKIMLSYKTTVAKEG